jgi:DNA polymerase (family 10)
VPKPDIQTVAKLLREYAQRTALRGGNPYRSKAYLRAADALSALAVPLGSADLRGAAYRNSRRWGRDR